MAAMINIASPARKVLLQSALIAAVAAAAAVVDGSARGWRMPSLPPPKIMATAPPVLDPGNMPTPDADSEGDEPEAVAESLLPEGALDAATLARLARQGLVNMVDARPADQYRQGHIPGAWGLPFEEFTRGGTPAMLEFLDPSMRTVVYCEAGDCHASEMVAAMLAEAGFSQVEVFTPGIDAWLDAGFPLAKGDQP